MVGPGSLDYVTKLEVGMALGILAASGRLEQFAKKFKLKQRAKLRSFAELLAPIKAGIAEVVIPPDSKLVGKSARDVWLRKVYGLGLVALHHDGAVSGGYAGDVEPLVLT